MKKILFAGFAMIFLFSCATGQTQAPKDPFAYIGYGTLVTSLSSYKIINDVFTNLRRANEVSDSAWAKYSELGNAFLDKHAAVARAMADYKRGLMGQSAAEMAVSALNLALNELTNYYNDQIPADQRRPLIQ